MKLSTQGKRIRPLILFGPTAVGKTALTSKLFNNLTELISADSMQFYKEASIGTAKPTKEELSAFTYHLIDFLDPRKSFTSRQFIERVNFLVPQIIARGHLPLISGGTAYYLKQYIEGPSIAPKTDMALATKLSNKLKESDAKTPPNCESPYRQELYNKLCEVDQVSASKIHINDSYRLVRAIECFLTNGRPLSSFKVDSKSYDIDKLVVVGIKLDREILYRRINDRVDKMIQMGLVEEVKGLLNSGYDFDTPVMRGIGYQEFSSYQTVNGHYEKRELLQIIDKIKQHSRNYAKKQLTFFSTIKNVFWFDANDFDGLYAFLLKMGYGDFLCSK